MKILVIRTDRIGEVLLSTPIATALKEKWPKAKISMMVRPEVRQLVEGNPYLDEVIEYGGEGSRVKGQGLKEAVRLKKIFKEKRFDIAVIVNPKKEFHAAAFLARIPVRVGFDRKWGFLLTHKVKDLKYLAEKHEVEYNLDLVRALGIEPKDKRPVLAVSDSAGCLQEASLLGATGKHIIAIHPCTSNPLKQWPEESFARLGDLLVENGYNIVVVSGLSEVKIARDVINRMGHKPIDLTGKVSLKELAVLFKSCEFLVSNDSGPVHIAAAVGTRVIALFGQRDPGGKPTRWRPYGEGHIVIAKENIEDITPEEVAKVIKVKKL
jgi:lipopolysaccharide heptosyltransferase II